MTENELLLKDIKQSFEKSKQSYGAVRMTAEMNSLGHTASRPRIARLMKAANLKVRKIRKFRTTTDSNRKYPIAPNLLNRAFTVQRRAQVWVSDITYVKTNQGRLYLTVIIGL